MKRFCYVFLVFNLIGIPKTEAQNSPDFEEYANVSLQDFYQTVLSCLGDPGKESLIMKNYEECIDKAPHLVADIVDPFPRDWRYSFEDYMSNVRRHYARLLRKKNVSIQIEPSEICVKGVEHHGDTAEVRLTYQVTFRNGSKVLFDGQSEAVIIYPEVYNGYNYKVKSILPRTYIAYRKSIHSSDGIHFLVSKAMRDGDYAMAKSLYEKLIEEGETDYLINLADMYYLSLGVKRDSAMAYLLLERLSKKNTARGKAAVAYIYSEGLTVPKDLGKALDFAQAAADEGDGWGCLILGCLTWSYEYLLKALDKGITEAYYQLARMSSWSDDVESFNKYVAAGMEAGAPQCYVLKGKQYEDGIDVEEDLSKARYYYSIAMEKYGFYQGYMHMGNLCASSNQMDQAIACYEKLYKIGHQSGGNKLFDYYAGVSEVHSNSSPTDSVKAQRMKALAYVPDDFMKEAKVIDYDFGYTRAFRVMQIYLNELPIPDYKKAYAYACQFVEHGKCVANYELAEMYFGGKGVNKDLAKAETLYGDYLKCERQRGVIGAGAPPLSSWPDFPEKEWEERKFHSLKQIGYLTKLRGDVDMAIEYYEKALKVRESKDIYTELYSIYNNAEDKKHFNPEKAKEMKRRSGK